MATSTATMTPHAVTDTPVQIVAPAGSRKRMIVQNVGTNDVAIGLVNTVVCDPTDTTNCGMILKGNISPPAAFGNDLSVTPFWAVAASGTSSVVIVFTEGGF